MVLPTVLGAEGAGKIISPSFRERGDLHTLTVAA